MARLREAQCARTPAASFGAGLWSCCFLLRRCIDAHTCLLLLLLLCARALPSAPSAPPTDFGLSIDITQERPVTRVGTLDYMVRPASQPASPAFLTQRCPDSSKHAGAVAHSAAQQRPAPLLPRMVNAGC